MRDFITKGAGLLGAALILAWAAPALAQVPPAPGPQKAGIIALAPEAVPVTVTLTGQAAAVQDASVRPRVDGVITGVLYEPGRPVTVGTPLFSIDPTNYEAALSSARASQRSAEAAVLPARSTVARYERLVGTGVTEEALETARMTLAQAEAAVAVAEAAVQTAEINLDRATIRSPLDGVPDVPEVSVGDLVTSGQSTVLTTVTSMDPIHVDLSEASARMLELRARIEDGTVKAGDELAVSLTLENGQVFAGTGTLSSVGSRVSTTTGTVRVRFRFENPDHLIMPGMFVRASVTLGTSEAYLVPQMAATVQADGTVAVWVLDAQDRATQKQVTPIGSTASAWIVAAGLEPGERLMVDNIENMTAGTEIEPLPVTVSAGGVVQDQAAADAQGGN